MSFAHYLASNFNPKKKEKEKINSKNDKLTWKKDIINYHIKFILTQSHGPHLTQTHSRDKQHKSQKG